MPQNPFYFYTIEKKMKTKFKRLGICERVYNVKFNIWWMLFNLSNRRPQMISLKSHFVCIAEKGKIECCIYSWVNTASVSLSTIGHRYHKYVDTFCIYVGGSMIWRYQSIMTISRDDGGGGGGDEYEGSHSAHLLFHMLLLIPKTWNISLTVIDFCFRSFSMYASLLCSLSFSFSTCFSQICSFIINEK